MNLIPSVRFSAVLLSLFFIFALGAPASPSTSHAGGIPWKEYDDAINNGKNNEQPIYLYFFTNSCGYCRKMDGKTFTSERVIEYMEDTFISSRVDADKTPHLARKYMVRGFPTSWFLNAEGEAIVSVPGYIPPDDFLKVLRYIGGGYYKSKSYQEFLKGS